MDILYIVLYNFKSFKSNLNVCHKAFYFTFNVPFCTLFHFKFSYNSKDYCNFQSNVFFSVYFSNYDIYWQIKYQISQNQFYASYFMDSVFNSCFLPFTETTNITLRSAKNLKLSRSFDGDVVLWSIFVVQEIFVSLFNLVSQYCSALFLKINVCFNFLNSLSCHKFFTNSKPLLLIVFAHVVYNQHIKEFALSAYI